MDLPKHTPPSGTQALHIFIHPLASRQREAVERSRLVHVLVFFLSFFPNHRSHTAHGGDKSQELSARHHKRNAAAARGWVREFPVFPLIE